jgi:cytochrome c oxidase subunit 2
MILTIVAAVLATAIGIALSFIIHWFPVQATTQARNTDRLYHVLVIACVPIFVLVVTVILYCAWQFRMKPGEELKDGPPIHGNTRLNENERKPKGVPEVQIGVTGQQFFWSYEYPSSVTGGAPLKSYQLYLPKGDTVFFNMRSRDVIHAFWIPAFRLQEDVVPGITTHYRATLTRLGDYPVVCNLLCGAGHSLMRSQVHVVTPAQFQAWLKSQKTSGAPVATASATPARSARRADAIRQAAAA